MLLWQEQRAARKLFVLKKSDIDHGADILKCQNIRKEKHKELSIKGLLASLPLEAASSGSTGSH